MPSTEKQWHDLTVEEKLEVLYERIRNLSERIYKLEKERAAK